MQLDVNYAHTSLRMHAVGIRMVADSAQHPASLNRHHSLKLRVCVCFNTASPDSHALTTLITCTHRTQFVRMRAEVYNICREFRALCLPREYSYLWIIASTVVI